MACQILVVDDDPMIRMLISEYLKVFGHAVHTVENGTECLSYLFNNVPDIVFLDLQMPDMTGIQVLETLRADPRTAKLPVVLLSANVRLGQEHQHVRADRYLEKPFEMQVLIETVESLVPGRSPG